MSDPAPDLPSPNGSSNGHRQCVDPGAGASTDEQTLARRDRALADADQTSSDGDQTSADSDQLAADRDQAASDHDLSAGVDARAYELSRGMRERSVVQSGQSAQARLDAAHDRNRIARVRELAALARDTAGDARDLAMGQRDAGHGRAVGAYVRVSGADVDLRASEQRKRAAELRELASEQRVLVAADRRRAVADRDQAAAERLRTLADLEALASQLAIAAVDPITGARTRAAGLIELDHELDRSRRTDSLLVVAYVDIVGLKAVNDSEGHAAGDELPRRVVALVAQRLRPYDLTGGRRVSLCDVQYGCRGRSRLLQMRSPTISPRDPRRTRSPSDSPSSPSADTAASLIARADSELLESRGANLDPRPNPSGDPGRSHG